MSLGLWTRGMVHYPVNPTHFIVLSSGESATMWLATALNNLPDTIAFHEFIPVEGTRESPLSAIRNRPEQRSGAVAMLSANALLKSVLRDDLEGLGPWVAKVCRNPVMTAESRYSRTYLRLDARTTEDVQIVSALIASDRWRSVNVKWSDKLKFAFSSGNDVVMRRVTAIWMRLSLEALDFLSYEVLLGVLEKMGEKAPVPGIGIFRYEDFTSQPAAFCTLARHLTGGTVTTDEALKVFNTPEINKHRASRVADPETVYGSWGEEEHEVFDTILVMTGLKRMFEEKCGYQFPYIREDKIAPYSTKEKYIAQSRDLTMNMSALL